ncbi:hypothetical protein SLEP1_g51685 [Rubroshorea leprosula]|uniref:Uncharacterized protein n=1 Tax=Rubroshorea leprosula TaxID=152421 RepID=A0AAV5M3Y6_9ROSI|nr:hypothetical protein SLEP1_g51685 [Rubroshorea leprosula]
MQRRVEAASVQRIWAGRRRLQAWVQSKVGAGAQGAGRGVRAAGRGPQGAGRRAGARRRCRGKEEEDSGRERRRGPFHRLFFLFLGFGLG